MFDDIHIHVYTFSGLLSTVKQTILQALYFGFEVLQIERQIFNYSNMKY